MKKHIITALACTAVLTLLCACGPSSGNSSSTPIGSDANNSPSYHSLTLPFSYNDSLNPYRCKTKVNHELSSLLYDPLIKLNNGFGIDCFLAESVTIEKTTCTVRIKDVKFSNGDRLSSDDIIFSIKQAISSGSEFAKRLSNIDSYYTDGERAVKIKLKKGDPSFINLLDFPILKRNSTSLKDENNRELPPIGCGRYTYDYNDGKHRLIKNGSYYGARVHNSPISLIDTPDETSLEHYMKCGSISMVYSDMSNNSIPKMSGRTASVPQTNLVFIGVNRNSVLSDVRMRQAIHLSLDREKLKTDIYFNYVEPVSTLFPAGFLQNMNASSDVATQNFDQAVAYLHQLGYNRKDSDGYLINDSGKKIILKLLYNNENSLRKETASLIVRSLKKVGIEVRAVEKRLVDYMRDVSSGSYDLYIGEVKLENNFNVSAFLSEEVLGPGFIKESTGKLAFDQFYSGEKSFNEAIIEFNSELPVIPLCYRNGVLVYSDSIRNIKSVSVSDIYNGVGQLIK